MVPRTAALAGAAVALAVSGAAAQDLPRLHITALGMHADRAHVAPGDVYHITIHVHVTERRDRLDELVLPALSNATDLGDERRQVAAGDGGTDFYEVMTVSSPQAGTASFSPAYIDAIAPNTGHGMRYSSQPVNVRVGDAVSLDRATRRAAHALRDFLLFGVIALAVLALAIVLVIPRTRRPRRGDMPPPPPSIAPAQPVRGDALSAAVDAFRARGDDAALDTLRNVLFARAGARAGATFTDALAALAGRDPQLGRAIAIAEQVRFGPQLQRAGATRDLLDALDAVLRDAVPAG